MKHSKREFVVQTSLGNTVTEMLQPSASDIHDNKDDVEVYYALQDIFDKVLDLAKCESMYFQPNRDNKDSKGIITRVR